MGEHRFLAVYRSDPENGERRNLRSGEVHRLTVAKVEDDVFGREVDEQADKPAPPQRYQAARPKPAKQPQIRQDYLCQARPGPTSVLLHPNPDGHLPTR